MDKEELIERLAVLRDEMTRAKRPDVAVIMSYIMCAMNEDMSDQFAFLCYQAINTLIDKRREGQLVLAEQVNEALADIEWER